MRLHEVMWPNKYMLMVLGLWPMRPGTGLVRRLFSHFRFIVALSLAICMLVPILTIVFINWGDIGVLGDLGSLLTVHFLLTLKMLYYVLRRRSFRSMYQHIKDFWDITYDSHQRRHYELFAKSAKLVTIAGYFCGLADLLSFQAAALITWMRSRREVEECHRPLLLELSYGIDTQQTPTYELVYVCQSLCEICVVGAVISINCTMMVFIVHVSGQFKLIGHRFRAIGRKIAAAQDDKDNNLMVRAKIGKCVAQHQHTIRVANELSALLSPVIFGQIMSSGLDICFGGYALIYGEGSAVNIFKFFVLLVSLLMQLVVFCAPAELLIHESTAIADAIYYDVPWFQLTPSIRRDLGFVMMRAQKGSHVTAFYQTISMGKITEVFNAAGSYLALLKNLKK